MRNIDSKCTYKTNPRCFISRESSYNANCCSPDQPCGIEQGGCAFDDDCFDNLECVKDNCGLNSNETSCCQAPGRRPGLLNKRVLISYYKWVKLLLLYKYDSWNSSKCFVIVIIVDGGWGSWRTLSVDHCQNEPNRKVMQVRDCNNPVPRFGGALCPNPLDHEREITCHEANYTSIETIFYIATA